MGLRERLPGVKWPRSGLVSCSAACHMQARQGQAYSQCKGNAQHLMAIQYIVLEGVNGSMVLTVRAPLRRVLLWPVCP